MERKLQNWMVGPIVSMTLVAAKLWGGLTWSWWIVFLPALLLLIVAFLILVMLVFALVAAKGWDWYESRK